MAVYSQHDQPYRARNAFFGPVGHRQRKYPFNLCFSHIKIPPPAEYASFGRALTTLRREAAENGPEHQLARKLGALFEDVIPKTPKLLAAYGTRCSEIIRDPAINTGGTERYGPFAEFVGADGTSIWAAATSSPSSLAVHLLACMLAKVFDASKATSIWEEIVEAHQRQIEESRASGAPFDAAQCQYPRHELARLDTSARAWMRSADVVMHKQQTQLQLLLEGINVPVAPGASVYEGVLNSWTLALVSMEGLLAEEALITTDGAILLAVSGWHLYPMVYALGSETGPVLVGDPLMPPAALLTIETTGGSARGSDRGIYWSLALSSDKDHALAVPGRSEAEDRLTIEDVHLVALGALFRRWDIHADFPVAARWFVTLGECMDLVNVPGEKLAWLQILVQAAKRLVVGRGDEANTNWALWELGYRRGKNFFGTGEGDLPWFGLRMPHILATLSQADYFEAGVEYLRQMAEVGQLQDGDAFISTILHRKDLESHLYATAVPHTRTEPYPTDEEPPTVQDLPSLAEDEPPRKKGKKPLKSEDGPRDGNKHCIHRRWAGIFPPKAGDLRNQLGPSSVYQQQPSFASSELQRLWGGPPRSPHGLFMSRGPSVSGEDEETLGQEDGLRTYSPEIASSESQLRICNMVWYSAPRLFAGAACELPCSCLNVISPGGDIKRVPVQFDQVFGFVQDHFRLWIRNEATFDLAAVHAVQSGDCSTTPLVDLESATTALKTQTRNPALLRQYLDGLDLFIAHEETFALSKSVLKLMNTERRQFASTVSALRNLALATDVYRDLDGATISSSLIDKPFTQVKWNKMGRDPVLTRPIALACIIMLETGYLEIDPDKLQEVFAVSSGNSLFAASALLRDPSTTLHGPSSLSIITRISGSLGRPGLSLLIPPTGPPRMKSLSPSERGVTYEPFDRKRENNFRGTTLYLSLNKSEDPYEILADSEVENEALFLESVPSVRDQGQWIADLDVAIILQEKKPSAGLNPSSRPHPDRPHSAASIKIVEERFICIDTWEQLLGERPGIGVIRARGNWAARLAISIFLAQRQGKEDGSLGEDTSVASDQIFAFVSGKDEVCWECMCRKMPTDVRKDSTRAFYLID